MAFEPFELEWAGKKYVIPAHRVMGAIARVEDVVTLPQLQEHGTRGSMPMAKISMAYGALLRYAGAPVTDVEVYEGMFGSIKENPQSLVDSVVVLISLMVPPSVVNSIKKKAAEPSSGNVEPAAKKASLKARTKSRSASGK